MQRIFSTRLDESVLEELDRASRRLGISKRRFIEEAVRLRAGLDGGADADVWAETLGAWRRRERPETTVRKARRAFQRSVTRHHGRHARLHR